MLLLGKNLQSEMSLSEVQHWLGSVTFQGAGRFIWKVSIWKYVFEAVENSGSL